MWHAALAQAALIPVRGITLCAPQFSRLYYLPCERGVRLVYLTLFETAWGIRGGSEALVDRCPPWSAGKPPVDVLDVRVGSWCPHSVLSSSSDSWPLTLPVPSVHLHQDSIRRSSQDLFTQDGGCHSLQVWQRFCRLFVGLIFFIFLFVCTNYMSVKKKKKETRNTSLFWFPSPSF